MAGRSNIEWTDRTWNPIVGCDIYSPGCIHCYAMKMAARIQKMNRTSAVTGYVNHYDGTTKVVNGNVVWTGEISVAPDKLFNAPLGWSKRARVFVNSMGDLHHEKISFDLIDRAVRIMAKTPHLTYQLLTKRAAGMEAYWSDPDLPERIGAAMPLPNVWHGVSCERTEEAIARIPFLQRTPSVVRFVSLEPLLSPIDLINLCNGYYFFDALTGYRWHDNPDADNPPQKYAPGLDWVIVGGESGPKARPMHPDWARSLRNQCAAAGVPFFFKQWGGWAPGSELESGLFEARRWNGNAFVDCDGSEPESDNLVYRVNKKIAGRLLDGRSWNEFPEPRAS